MASVSMAARDSFLVTTVSRVNSQARSLAVRSDHLPPTRTRLTPRGAYSFCNWMSSPCRSLPAGSRAASVFSSSGSSAANSSASRMRNSSARSLESLSPMITRISATLEIMSASPSSIPRFHRNPAFVPTPPVADVERSKRCVLMHLKATLAHQFECCGKTRSANCRGVRGLDHVGDEIVIEHAPVGLAPDQPLDRLTRFGEQPDRALGHAHEGSGLLLPLPRIGRKQIVECCRPLRPFDLGDRLRPPTRKHLTAELRPVEQLFGHLPDRLEPPQALRETG